MGCGCLFALFAGAFPRVAFFLLWLFNPTLIDRAWGSWIWPLLGLLFLPFTAIMWVLVWQPGVGIAGWGWFWVGLGLVLDLGSYGANGAQARRGYAK